MNASLALLESVVHSTVLIEANIPEKHPSVQVLGDERLGSGTIVDVAGIVVTVNYVVLGAKSVKVTTLDGNEYVGRVVAQDFASGMALLDITAAEELKALEVRREPELCLGDEVFIVAAVGGGGRRAAGGVVTSLDPFDANWEYRLDRAILTSALNPGLGGGPLIDMRGRLVGVVSLSLEAVGKFSLAIPISHYYEHSAELLRFGRRKVPARAWLGLFCYTIREHIVVAGLLDGSPAERSGIKAGDVIISIDGHEVNCKRAFYERLWSHRAGEKVKLTVYRNNAVVTLEAESGDAEEFFAAT